MDIQLVKHIIWAQFGAAIETLENAITACPESLWNDRSRTPQYWYLAYHALFFLDLYLSDSAKGFCPPPPFSLSEFDRPKRMPERIYSKVELSDYLEHGRTKCIQKVKALTEESSALPCGFSWVKGNNAELFLYNMRHVQHHAAQLNLILRQVLDAAPTWVFGAKE